MTIPYTFFAAGSVTISKYCSANWMGILLYKKLNVEHSRYRWSRNRSEVQTITWQQFDWLMSDLEIEPPKVIKISLNFAGFLI